MSDIPDPGANSPLHDIHVAAGASFTDFAGWNMPVRYSSELEEHRAVRTAAGLFDLSHMGEILVEGPDAAAALDHALSMLVSTLALGQARYGFLLTEGGGVIDDVIVYRTGVERFLVVANAGNREVAARELFARSADFDAVVTDECERWALLAVQGPAAVSIVAALEALDLPVPLDSVRNYRSTSGTWRDVDVLVARTGYTGEDGFELYVETDAAAELWAALMRAGSPLGLVPAGLACRDTLRLEAGMPLYGHELSRDIRPAQAGLGRSVRLHGRGDFVGRAASEQPVPDGARLLVGLVSDGRRAGRAGYPVVTEDGAVVGEVTSGALSPTLGHPVAMAFVDPGLTEPGTALFIDVRGKQVAASVVPLPFYKRSTPERKVAS